MGRTANRGLGSTSSSKRKRDVEGSCENFFKRRISFEDACVAHIVLDFAPLRVVEAQGFRLVCDALSMKAKSMSRASVRKHLNLQSAKKRAYWKDALKDVPSICLTSDMWSDIHGKDFLGLTAYWITTTWQMKSKVLACESVKHAHTGVNIAMHWRSLAAKWQLDGRVYAITTDNA